MRPRSLATFRLPSTVRVLEWGCLLVIGFVVLYPLFWLVLGSFRADPSSTDFNLDAYYAIFEAEYMGEVLWNTAVMSAGVTSLSVLIGVPLAWIVGRTDTPLKNYINMIAILPFIMPPVVVAVAWAYLGTPRVGFVNLFWKWLIGTREPLVRHLHHGRAHLRDGAVPGALRVHLHGHGVQEHGPDAGVRRPRERREPVENDAPDHATHGGAGHPLRRAVDVHPVAGGFRHTGDHRRLGRHIRFLDPALAHDDRHPAELLTRRRPVHPHPAGLRAGALGQTRALGRSARYTTVAGKSFRPRLVELGPWKYLALAFASFYLLVSAILPVLTLIYGTFISNRGRPPTLEYLTLGHLVEIITGDGERSSSAPSRTVCS